MAYDLIISNGLLVDGNDYDHAALEIGIRDGKIAAVAAHLTGEAPRHDAGGNIVMPGLIDPHVHLNLPMKGVFSSDTVASGTRAALLGGVTTVLDFTLQEPGQSLTAGLEKRQAEFAENAYTDYGFHVCITDFPADWAGRIAADLSAVRRLGAKTLKVFTCYSREGLAIAPSELAHLLAAAAEREMLVLVHAEADGIHIRNEEALLAAGKKEPIHFPASRPPQAEITAIADASEAAINTGAPIYFVHVSTAGGVAAIRAGRQRSAAPIYLETCPQYFTLDDRVYDRPDAELFLVAPPLRPRRDKSKISGAVIDGTVDIIATDHCPFSRAQKQLSDAPFTAIPNGLPGLETRLALVNTIFAATGQISMSRLVQLTALNPARIHGLYPRKGSLAVGADADLTIFCPQTEWAIAADRLEMNTDFSPYEGLAVTGVACDVLLRGEFAVRGGELVGGQRGEYLARA